MSGKPDESRLARAKAEVAELERQQYEQMIDRAAQAVWDECAQGCPWANASEESREMCRGSARAVLQAVERAEAWDRWYGALPIDLQRRLSFHDFKRLGDAFKGAFLYGR